MGNEPFWGNIGSESMMRLIVGKVDAKHGDVEVAFRPGGQHLVGGPRTAWGIDIGAHGRIGYVGSRGYAQMYRDLFLAKKGLWQHGTEKGAYRLTDVGIKQVLLSARFRLLDRFVVALVVRAFAVCCGFVVFSICCGFVVF